MNFYNADNDASPNTTAKLYTTGTTDAFNGDGTYVVYFPTTGSTNKEKTDYNKAHVDFIPASTSGTSSVKSFGALDNFQSTESGCYEAADNYLGRASNEATYAGVSTDNYYTVVTPNEKGAVLNLKVNYTLVSTDGSGETINVTGATAKVPAVYGAWKSGYAYTYIFKISQNTNGVTNPAAGPAGLYPITFDAVVTETEDGIQETITSVSESSITTYAKGAVVTANNEYKAGNNIYVMINGVTLTATNAKLYTVTLDDDAAQTINEASVANALANGTESPTGTWKVKDANDKNMTVTTVTGSDAISIVDNIAAADAPDGNAITGINAAKFTAVAPASPATVKYYAFEYIKTPRVAATPAVYTAVADGTTLTSGTKYYTSNTGEGEFTSDGTQVANGTNYFELTTAAVAGTPGEYFYKIIKVVE